MKRLVLLNCKEIYHEKGEFSFRAIIDLARFKGSHVKTEISLVDAAGKSMVARVRPWGNKLNCHFAIDDNTCDGIATGELSIESESLAHVERISFWVIK